MDEQLTADPALQAKLKVANGSAVKLYDETGKLIGFALTPEQLQGLEFELAKARLSTEELNRRAATPGGHSTEEVFRLLELP